LFWGRIAGSTACVAVVMIILGEIWLCCNWESDDDRYRTVDDDETDDEVKPERIGSVS
jgi:Na+-transporting NADH:ubiquinone oxidoreductase subunit NqrB